MTFSFSLVSLGSWSNDSGNGSDNVTRFKADRSYSSHLICQILAIFFRSWTLKNCIEVYKKKTKSLFYVSRYSRAVTVKKCTKKRDANWVGPNRSDIEVERGKRIPSYHNLKREETSYISVRLELPINRWKEVDYEAWQPLSLTCSGFSFVPRTSALSKVFKQYEYVNP